MKVLLVGETKTGGLGRYKRELGRELQKVGVEIVSEMGDEPDLVHAAQNWGGPLLSLKPRVVTIHDVIPLSYPGFFEQSKFPFLSRRRYFLRIQLELLRARRVICVSETTCRDVCRRFWVRKEKVNVIYNGISKFPKPKKTDAEILKKFGLSSGRYLLNHGGIDPRKNLERLIRAFRKIKNGNGNRAMGLKLVITGEGGGRDSLERLICESGLKREVVFTGWVSDEEIGTLIKGARAIVYPTLAEGFGMPVLEGMAAGVPVVASAIDVLKEIGGEVPVYVDPEDEGEIARGISMAIDLSGSRIDQGLKKAEAFSWGETIKRTVNVYSEILGV